MKRRKTLSGTQPQHEEAQSIYLAQVRHAIDSAGRAVRQGKCVGAGKILLAAAASWGAYNAEKQWTEKVTARENATSNNYFAVRSEYLERCTKPGSLGGASRGRR